MMKAYQAFIGDPLRHRRFGLAWYRISQLLHDRTNGAFDAIYMRLARLLRPKVSLPASPRATPAEITEVVDRLRKEGYMILPFRLSDDDIEELTTFAFSTPGHGADMHKRVSISPGNIPAGEARFSWWMHELTRLPVVQRMITDGPYCAIAQEYLGCRPILAHVSLLLDAPYVGRFEPYLYHYDNEGPGFLKFFFFLTDVNIGTGSHYFISGTHPHTKPTRFARAGLYQEDDLFSLYSRDKEVVVRGPAGTILAEDTSGFHRGSKIERDFRLLLQIEFSVVDVPTDYELARKLTPTVVPGLHPGIGSIARKFLASAV